MTDIPDEEVASKPVAAYIPGFYFLRIWIKSKLKSMNVIESDDLTISRKLGGNVSYSESFSNVCTLAFSVCFLIITIGGNLLAISFPEESASIFELIDLLDRIVL